MEQNNFHYIARGIIRDELHFLLCKQRDGDYTFLLGGHIEFGEPAKIALAREIKEEIGASVSIGKFLGAIENAWDGQSEISLVFDVKHSLCKDQTPQPASEDESHLEFVWVSAEELGEYNLLPTPSIKILQDQNSMPFWASTIVGQCNVDSHQN